MSVKYNSRELEKAGSGAPTGFRNKFLSPVQIQDMKKNAPVHYVDTCVFIEALTSERTEDGRQCRRYLSRLGKIFQWTLSAPVLYEFYYHALQQGKKTYDMLADWFWILHSDKLPRVLQPEQGLTNLGYVQNLDDRLSHMDSLHLAGAVGNANVFVTIDRKILESSSMRQLGFSLAHPSEFV